MSFLSFFFLKPKQLEREHVRGQRICFFFQHAQKAVDRIEILIKNVFHRSYNWISYGW